MTGQKLRLLREFRNYSQEYIAEKLGITQHAYSRIENNLTKLTAERLEKLAVILNIPPLELLSDKEPVIYFSEPGSPVSTSAKEDQWKDEKIAFLENEIRALRKERDRIIHLVEKLTGSGAYSPAVSS